MILFKDNSIVHAWLIPCLPWKSFMAELEYFLRNLSSWTAETTSRARHVVTSDCAAFFIRQFFTYLITRSVVIIWFHGRDLPACLNVSTRSWKCGKNKCNVQALNKIQKCTVQSWKINTQTHFTNNNFYFMILWLFPCKYVNSKTEYRINSSRNKPRPNLYRAASDLI